VDPQTTAPITFAHRGASADAPENTMAAFRLALDLGARGLESDARLSADGEVVLVHGAVARAGWRRRRVDIPLERHAAHLAEVGIGVVNMHRSDWTAGLVGLFHRFGVQAFGWDAQEVRHLRELLAMDIDAVYSDHVARMVATVGEFTT